MTLRSLFPRCWMYMLAVSVWAAVPVFGDDWKPIDPAQLAMKAPIVEKDADAEAIFWEGARSG